MGRDRDTVTAVQRQRSECKYRGGLHCVMSRSLEREIERRWEEIYVWCSKEFDDQAGEQILEYFDWALLETGV